MSVDRIRLYFDYASSRMSEIAREHLETLMATGTYEYQSDFARKYYGDGIAAGEARGEASAVLTVLAARGIAVSDKITARILACTDLDRLTTWVVGPLRSMGPRTCSAIESRGPIAAGRYRPAVLGAVDPAR